MFAICLPWIIIFINAFFLPIINFDPCLSMSTLKDLTASCQWARLPIVLTDCWLEYYYLKGTASMLLLTDCTQVCLLNVPFSSLWRSILPTDFYWCTSSTTQWRPVLVQNDTGRPKHLCSVGCFCCTCSWPLWLGGAPVHRRIWRHRPCLHSLNFNHLSPHPRRALWKRTPIGVVLLNCVFRNMATTCAINFAIIHC